MTTMNTEADIDTLCQSMETLTVAAAAVPAKKRITKSKKPDPVVPETPPPSETEPPIKKKRAPRAKTPKNIVPTNLFPETVPEEGASLSAYGGAAPAPIPFRWHNYTLDYERILQSFFVADGRYVGLADVGGKVDPVFFVACSSNWSSKGELPVIFVESTTHVDEAGVDHFEPRWDNPTPQGGRFASSDSMLTVAAMYNCMPYDAKRDYTRA
jgi:hypothetical protein